jgi:oligopeptide/dipeptide ABC transporter ATP-binding protein
MAPLLEVENLSVEYRRGGERVPAVRNVSLSLAKGERLGVAGESGCGKSTLALSVPRLLPDRESRVTGGRVVFEGRDLLELSGEQMRAVRGGRIGVVFQDPFSALNPVLTVGEQIEECLELHKGGRDRAAALRLIERVRLPSPERVYSAYPHQLSGGQRQRACIAMAVAAGPSLLIADEPTTALDATLQGEVLDLLDELRRELGLAVVFITHNVGLLSERTERLAVMYAGEIVEIGATAEVLRDPRHPYTRELLKSLPRLGGKQRGPLPMLAGQPPDPRAVPPGCPFHPRCPRVFERCRAEDPELRSRQGRDSACHLYE